MPRLLISLGANLGDTYATMLSASSMLNHAFGREACRYSRLFRTPPIGGPSGQSEFLNAVASIETDHSCWDVWDIIKRIERDLGRQRQHRWEARRIDMDILLHGTAKVWTPHLKIPHPRMCMRSFVLGPAMDVAPDAIEPVTGWSIAHLHENLINAAGRTTVVFVNEESIHREIPAEFDDRHVTGLPALRWIGCPAPEKVAEISTLLNDQVALSIFCVRTPDPETIQWEDYAYPWARVLNLTESVSESALHGPRYLLPANDLSWTVHEILASRDAMTCRIEPLDRPWADLG